MTYGLEAANSQTGSKDGYPAAVYFFFGSVALFSAALDVRMIVRGGVFGAHRIARHLWRMCFALLIGATSQFSSISGGSSGGTSFSNCGREQAGVAG